MIWINPVSPPFKTLQRSPLHLEWKCKSLRWSVRSHVSRQYRRPPPAPWPSCAAAPHAPLLGCAFSLLCLSTAHMPPVSLSCPLGWKFRPLDMHVVNHFTTFKSLFRRQYLVFPQQCKLLSIVTMLCIRSPELICNFDQHLLISPLAPLVGPTLYLILPLPFLPSNSSAFLSLLSLFSKHLVSSTRYYIYCLC